LSTFVQLIDLHTRQPAELARVLDQWRAHSLRREHIAAVEVRHDDQDAGHLVLQVEYDASTDARPDASATATPEAAAVVGLLDRPPRFR
jgi:hypothetical protein